MENETRHAPFLKWLRVSLASVGAMLLVTALGLPAAEAAPVARDHPGACAPQPSATPGVQRVGGADRFAVSAAVSGVTSQTRGLVFITSGLNFPDALSASDAAGLVRAPILLVTRDSIPPVVQAELTRLSPVEIIIVGGPASVSPEVMDSLKSYTPLVSRFDGADRYEVSAAVSNHVFTGVNRTAYVASGTGFADALSASAAAGSEGGPVLLVGKDEIPPSIIEAIRTLQGLERIVVVGGPESVSDNVVAGLAEIARTNRISGDDRYAVSANVSADEFCSDLATVFIASGAVFPDALSGSAAAIRNQAPVLLVAPDRIPPPIGIELRRLNPQRIVVLGGPNSVSESVFQQLQAFLRH